MTEFDIKRGATHWNVIRSLYYRRGAAVPVQGWRSAGNAKFFTEEDCSFDEYVNFSSSEIGSLASAVRTKLFGKRTLFFINGISRYLPCNRPCNLCEHARKECKCNPIVAAIKAERDELFQKYGTEFFPIDLLRNFTLKKSPRYGDYPRVTNNKLTPESSNDSV